jgi:hypothetical protein
MSGAATVGAGADKLFSENLNCSLQAGGESRRAMAAAKQQQQAKAIFALMFIGYDSVAV